jgi:hypothetical protein
MAGSGRHPGGVAEMSNVHGRLLCDVHGIRSLNGDGGAYSSGDSRHVRGVFDFVYSQTHPGVSVTANVTVSCLSASGCVLFRQPCQYDLPLASHVFNSLF